MQELRALATYAAQNSIRGTSFKRNSLLKPLDIIMQELDRCPAPENLNELELIRAGTKELIFDHLERIAKTDYKPGRTKRRALQMTPTMKTRTELLERFKEHLMKMSNGKGE